MYILLGVIQVLHNVMANGVDTMISVTKVCSPTLLVGDWEVC